MTGPLPSYNKMLLPQVQSRISILLIHGTAHYLIPSNAVPIHTFCESTQRFGGLHACKNARASSPVKGTKKMSDFLFKRQRGIQGRGLLHMKKFQDIKGSWSSRVLRTSYVDESENEGTSHFLFESLTNYNSRCSSPRNPRIGWSSPAKWNTWGWRGVNLLLQELSLSHSCSHTKECWVFLTW